MITPRKRRLRHVGLLPGHGGAPGKQSHAGAIVPGGRRWHRKSDPLLLRPGPSELQRLLLAIHNKIQGCRTELRSCRDDVNVCVCRRDQED